MDFTASIVCKNIIQVTKDRVCLFTWTLQMLYIHIYLRINMYVDFNTGRV